MPTGYTADVSDGKTTTLAQFLRDCSRCFILDLRDEPRGTPIPRTSDAQAFSVKHHTDEGAKALNEIHRLHGLTEALVTAEATAWYNREQNEFMARATDREQRRNRYEDMRAAVRDWTAPDSMKNVRDFMLEQLAESIRFDCEGWTFPAPQKVEPAEWLTDRIIELQKSVAYHHKEKEAAEERQKTWGAFYGDYCDEIERLGGTP